MLVYKSEASLSLYRF